MRSLKITQSITDRQDASLGLYFKDVSKIPRITPEEEINLSKRIKSGDFSAVNKLVEANLRFVISVAKQYQNKGLPLVDLIQIGSEGAIEAAKRWDGERGIKFISYAVWWIRQSIMKAISDQCRTVRVPMSQIVYINKINKVSEKFEQTYGRSPSYNELEENTNIDASKIGIAMSAINRTVSLEAPLRDEDVNCLLDIIPNNNSDPVDNELHKSDLLLGIEKVLAKLPNRDSDIIRMSFGIGVHAMPNDEIAKRFGIGSERVRQIQHSALKYIRNNYTKELSELL